MSGYTWLAETACNSYSQFGEDGVLQAIFDVIGESNRWCLECGAADGLFFSNTRRLIEQGWHGVLVEADAKEHARLVENNKRFGDRVHCVHARVDDDNSLDDILAAAGAPRLIDLVVIDVDGQDVYLLNALLRYEPRVVVIEFDPNVAADFVPTLGGEGQAGMDATIRLAAGKFYSVVCRTFCNLILVRQPLDQMVAKAGNSTGSIS